MLFPKGETFSEHVSAKSYSLFTNISSFHIFLNPLHPNINVHILQLFSRHFLRCQHREFVQQSRAYLVGDQLFYSPDLNV